MISEVFLTHQKKKKEGLSWSILGEKKIKRMIFFWIGNKTFIEQKNWTSCSRWWTLWTMKQIQEDQELKEIETKKSATAVQFVHSQIWAQRNRVRKSKHFRCSKVLALSSKMRALCSC